MSEYAFSLCPFSANLYRVAGPHAVEGWTGMYLFGRNPGEIVLLTHGASDGSISWAEEPVPGAFIVCCYPAAVQQAHPEWNVIGSWKQLTRVGLVADQNTLLCWPEDRS